MEKEWLLSKNEYRNFNENKIESILYFSIIWNIFEKTICNMNARISTCPKVLAERYASDFNKLKLNNVYKYFKDRYTQNEHLYESLFRDSEYQYSRFVRKTFDKVNSSKEKKFQVILYIAFRLRNNLYHGNKAIDHLISQNKNFKQINILLMELIDSQFD